MYACLYLLEVHVYWYIYGVLSVIRAYIGYSKYISVLLWVFTGSIGYLSVIYWCIEVHVYRLYTDYTCIYTLFISVIYVI